ncbi:MULTISPECIES: 2OG-Fe(II) oxygenase [Pontibacillus]|uniref:2OG-Fe(II) oxygenase n=1 Tax=Pontibacillus chungwhensis TaxID=265426 RepID=A0ABY8V4E5_9BACI|nr:MULTISPECIES: 2OG-Fe(II) oxygenase [Pontibacillus]MCD5322164.1 2OG-Fe(II) oxygenase [Pontibacillus sp. HN14]WIF99459.1 2OG-Fe(II) oxygenase [Pontibacillus chungwhensis]
MTAQVEREATIFSHKGNRIITEDRTISVISKVEEPLIVVLDNVASEKECDRIITTSQDRLERSRIGQARETNEMRTSSGMFFEENENTLIHRMERRLSAIMNVPIEHAEGLQVLRYQPGQEYKPHHDYFKQSDNNRISTIVLYLNDVEEGGETLFPHLGLSVTPKKGMAVYFEYFYQDALLNEKTLHSGNPVVQGEKWVATQWMRRKPVR